MRRFWSSNTKQASTKQQDSLTSEDNSSKRLHGKRHRKASKTQGVNNASTSASSYTRPTRGAQIPISESRKRNMQDNSKGLGSDIYIGHDTTRTPDASNAPSSDSGVVLGSRRQRKSEALVREMSDCNPSRAESSEISRMSTSTVETCAISLAMATNLQANEALYSGKQTAEMGARSSSPIEVDSSDDSQDSSTSGEISCSPGENMDVDEVNTEDSRTRKGEIGDDGVKIEKTQSEQEIDKMQFSGHDCKNTCQKSVTHEATEPFNNSDYLTLQDQYNRLLCEAERLYHDACTSKQELEGISRENSAVRMDNENLQKELEGKEFDIKHAQSYIIKLREENESLTAQLNELRKDAFNLMKPIDVNGETHEALSRKFESLFKEVSIWAQEFFNYPLSRIDDKQEAYRTFKQFCNRFLYDDFLRLALESDFKARFIFEAYLNDIIAHTILLNPLFVFRGKTDAAYHVLLTIRDSRKKENPTEALNWRVNTFLGFKESEKTDHHRKKEFTEGRKFIINYLIDKVLKFAGRFLNPVSDKFRDKLRKIFTAAFDLSILLACEPAHLSTIDKRYFDESRTFPKGDDYFKGRQGEEEEEGDFLVGMVLHPAFLRISEGVGNAQEVLWIPAKLEVVRLSEKVRVKMC